MLWARLSKAYPFTSGLTGLRAQNQLFLTSLISSLDPQENLGSIQYQDHSQGSGASKRRPVHKQIFSCGRWIRNRASGEAKWYEAHMPGCGMTWSRHLDLIMLASAIFQDKTLNSCRMSSDSFSIPNRSLSISWLLCPLYTSSSVSKSYSGISGLSHLSIKYW